MILRKVQGGSSWKLCTQGPRLCVTGIIISLARPMDRKTEMEAYKSKVDIIYDYLLENIGRRKHKQGSKLVISQIAREMGTSEIPVREALRRLESEGYVEIRANQGAFVTGTTNGKILSAFQIRGVLEGFATRVAIDYMTEEAYSDLEVLNQKLEQCWREGEQKLFGQYNMEFHQRIYQQIPQVDLRDMLNDMWKRWSITRSVFALAPDTSKEILEQHHLIIQMMRNKQYDEVETLVRRHKFRAGVRMHQELMQDICDDTMSDELDELLGMPSMQPFL